jgi:HEPN domain-containing protein
VEKFIKAFLTKEQIFFYKTHDLYLLRSMIFEADKNLYESLNMVYTLSDYAVSARYPDDICPPDDEKTKNAIALSKRIQRLFKDILNDYL